MLLSNNLKIYVTFYGGSRRALLARNKRKLMLGW